MQKMLAGNPVIPVITLDQVEDAVPLAEALVAGGLKVLEVTLRTEAAVEGIRQIIKHVPEAIVGTGTVCSVEQIKLSEDLGCQFMISPGATDNLLNVGAKSSVPFLPGISTVSELMRGMEYGLKEFKFFPAEASGGAPALKAIGAPIPQVKFCPTGGVSPTNAASYLSLSNVLCAGGSWVAPKDKVDAGDWAAITALAKAASVLSR